MRSQADVVGPRVRQLEGWLRREGGRGGDVPALLGRDDRGGDSYFHLSARGHDRWLIVERRTLRGCSTDDIIRALKEGRWTTRLREDVCLVVRLLGLSPRLVADRELIG